MIEILHFQWWIKGRRLWNFLVVCIIVRFFKFQNIWGQTFKISNLCKIVHCIIMNQYDWKPIFWEWIKWRLEWDFMLHTIDLKMHDKVKFLKDTGFKWMSTESVEKCYVEFSTMNMLLHTNKHKQIKYLYKCKYTEQQNECQV